ncbi:MAG TPA: pilus assembly protein N-terminal domain-containing protein, partial [Polyangiaceae bacterium]|nr:pilus assembly protein N-terminal domain-containing protein [Polyangiaceae bacterium]
MLTKPRAHAPVAAAFVASVALLAASTALAQGPNASFPRPSGAPQVVSTVKTETIELEVGEQQVIPSEGVQSYSEGSKGIVDVRLTKDASQFVIVGVRDGSTTLLFLM